MSVEDKYVGDVAWRKWFEICCLDGCDEYSLPLMDEVASAFGRAVVRRQCQEKYSREYLLAYFDHYFQLGGDIEKPKPLKQYLLARVPNARDGFKGIVLGSILSLHGHVGTMSRNLKTIEDVGDEPLIPTDQDGIPIDIPGPVMNDPSIDKLWFYRKAEEFIKLLAEENKSEKIVTSAAMVYAMANKISPTRSIIQRILGVKQGGAFKKMHQMEESLRRFCKKKDIRPEAKEFVGVLLEVSAAVLKKEGVLKELEAAK